MATSEGSTIVGESIVISGNVHGDEDLTVRGRVEGTLTLTKTLVVEQSGVVKAEVQVKSCVISGAVVGNVSASESVEITKEGRMVGDISAPRVIIADGASFRGRIDMGEVNVEQDERSSMARAPRVVETRTAPSVERPVAALKPPAPPVPVAVGAVKRKMVVRRK